MADRVGLRLEGGRQLRATLKRAQIDIQDLKNAHALAARIVAEAGAARAPKVSGRLANTVRGSGAATQATARAGNAGVPYAGPIHWGWPARNIEPQPFLADALEATEEIWSPVYETAVERVLAKIRGV